MSFAFWRRRRAVWSSRARFAARMSSGILSEWSRDMDLFIPQDAGILPAKLSITARFDPVNTARPRRLSRTRETGRTLVDSGHLPFTIYHLPLVIFSVRAARRAEASPATTPMTSDRGTRSEEWKEEPTRRERPPSGPRPSRSSPLERRHTASTRALDCGPTRRPAPTNAFLNTPLDRRSSQ